MLLSFLLIAATVAYAINSGKLLPVTVGVYRNNPKIIIDDKNNITGFWPELITHIAKKENWKIRYVYGTWNDGLDRLDKGKINILLDVAYTEKRNKRYIFSKDPVLMSWTRVYVNQDNTEIESITDLKNKKIAALKGSVNLEGPGGLRELSGQFNLNCTFIEKDNYIKVFAAIESNEADAGITNRNFGNKNAGNFKIKKTAILFQPIYLKFAFPRELPSTAYLVEKINKNMKKLLRDENSLYYELLKKYFEAGITEKVVEVSPFWLRYLLLSVGAVLVFFILVVLISRVQVKKRTSEISRKNQALRDSEEYHRNLFEKSPTALFLQDFSGVEKQIQHIRSQGVNDLKTYLKTHPEDVIRMADSVVVNKINKVACRLFKIDSSKQYSNLLGRVLVIGDHQHFIDQIVAFISGEDHYEGKGRNHIADGELIDLLIHKAVINRRTNGLSKILVGVTDVTELHQTYKEKKKLESQLIQAQKMEAIGTLAGGIAHDFNNLLMGIQGRVSLMLSNIDEKHPHYNHLTGIDLYVKDATNLTRQLLGYARGGKFEVKPTDINSLIREQNEMSGRTRKDITIQCNYAKNIWTVEVDRVQIKQVLMNLYVNAWQAMPEGGNLYLQTKNVTVDENYSRSLKLRSGEYVKISVTDNGTGMDKITREKIFEPFFTTKKMGRGTGLGLASTYGIIKNHSGFINVYSQKGEGTTFNIYLPASKKSVEKEPVFPQKILMGTGTVLLIDDERIIIDVGALMIKKLGYKVMMTRDTNEALELYRKNWKKIDIVIIDMIMPHMSGGVLYDKLKQINPDIKAILSSGYSINGKASEILDRGCNGFIQKPFSLMELSIILRKIFVQP